VQSSLCCYRLAEWGFGLRVSGFSKSETHNRNHQTADFAVLGAVEEKTRNPLAED
jgi:hypothetical protein